MAGIETYPDGTPAAGDRIPYVEDPAGTPALKLVDVADLAGGGSGGALLASSGDPNDDPTVPSPPADVRALAFDRDSSGLDLYKWDIPTGTYVDNFVGTNGTNLIGATASNGATWTGLGTWTIESNTATQTGGAGDRRLVADWGSADVTVSMPLLTAHNEDGLVLRENTAANRRLILKKSGSTDLVFQRWTAGSYVNIALWTISVTDGMILSITLNGEDWSVSFNGTVMGSGTSGTLTPTVADTFHGLEAYGTTSFDSLTVEIAGTSPAWVPVGSGLG
jgi:hypothetical protein